MVIKGTWAEPCPDCGALHGCCESSKDRGEMADNLAELVGRQSRTITSKSLKIAELQGVIDDLRRKHEGVTP